MFDLSKDTGEEHDLSKEKPELLEKMKSRFLAWKKQMDEAETRRPFKNF